MPAMAHSWYEPGRTAGSGRWGCEMFMAARGGRSWWPGALAAAALAGGCAHKPPPVREVRLELVPGGGGGGPMPYVEPEVAGVPTRLLLDSGAFQSVVPLSLARERGLAVRSNSGDPLMVDASGRETRLGRLPGLSVRFQGSAEAGAVEFLVNPRPGSPAVLATNDLIGPGQALLIDLGKGLLAGGTEAEVVERLRAAPTAVEVPFEGCAGDGAFTDLHRVVTAQVNGVPARMMLDTGAERTMLNRNNPALETLLARRGGQGVTLGHGTSSSALLIDDVEVGLAGVAYPGSVIVAPASSRCWDGVIGTDVLRHCPMAWAEGSLWLACRAPDAGAQPGGGLRASR